MSKGVYAGVPTEVPIYEDTITELEGLSNTSYKTYFSIHSLNTAYIVTNTGLTYNGFRFSPGNIGDHSVNSVQTFTPLRDLKNVKVYCEYCTEKNYDKVTTVIAGTTIMDAVSGTDNTSLNLIWSGDLAAGEAIKCQYYKDGSSSASGEKVYWEITCDPLTEITQEIVGYETKELARKVKKLYTEALTSIPIYGEIEVEADGLTYKNFNTLYFNSESYSAGITLASGTTNGVEGFRFRPSNIGSGYGTSLGGTKLTLLHDLKNVKIYCEYYTYSQHTVYVTVAGTVVMNAVSGGTSSSSLSLIWSGDLVAGDVIDFRYNRSNTTTLSGEKVYWELTCDPALIKEEGIVGYEEKSVARLVKKGYIGVEGVARQFFVSEVFIGFSGDYTVSQVELDGATYNLYTLTSTGELTINDSVRYWMCGGGKSPSTATTKGTLSASSYYYYVSGAIGGGGGKVDSGEISSGTYTIVIGSGGVTNGNGGDTTISSSDGVILHTAAGATSYNGGSGGGGSGRIYFYTSESSSAGSSRAISVSGGTGDGVSTIPFGIEELHPHCGGGGGGLAKVIESDGSLTFASAGNGGTNGGNGSASRSSLTTSWTGGDGGEYGGGDGGNNASGGGKDATFYGGGGGGGYAYYSIADDDKGRYSAGDGYQGVCYLLIPA